MILNPLRYVVVYALVALSGQVFAFQCYLTLAKDSCWTNYDVKVVVLDSVKNSSLLTVEVPKGKSWVRQAFNCNPGMKLMYQATFQPVFWQNEKGKTYWAQHYWALPEKAGPQESAWNISVCYPAEFSAIPLPPDAEGNCKCDFAAIPPIPPAKQ